MSQLHSKAKFLAAVCTASLLTTAALADGGPRGSIKDAPRAAFSWDGFYVGFNAGYAWGDSTLASTFGCPAGAAAFPGGCAYPTTAAHAPNFAAFSAGASGSLSPKTFIGGVQAGRNWQSGTLVYGVELDFNSFSFEASRSASAAIPAVYAGRYSTGATVSTDWLFTARARLGVAVSPLTLLYVTGGLAMTDLNLSNSFADNVPPVTAGNVNRSELRTGWTVGGGAEIALNNNWTLKGEYLYVDLGTASATSILNTAGGFVGNTLATRADLSAHIARAGINYKF